MPTAGCATGVTNPASGSAFRYSASPGSYGGGMSRSFYPSPFLDVGQNYLPSSIREVLQQCEYFAMTHPLIASIVQKMSAYGITDLTYDALNEAEKEQRRRLYEDVLRLRQFLVGMFLDYHAYGIAFASVLYPFVKLLICRNCGHVAPAFRTKYRVQQFQFRITCSECGHDGIAKVHDFYYLSPHEIRLVRWYPRHITVEQAGYSGRYVYRYHIPNRVRSAIMIGKPMVVANTPQFFLESLRLNRPIVFRHDHIFALKRESISREDQSWGMPLIMPVLKDAYYLQILKKGQEAIALDHTVPLRVLFPQASSSTGDPYQYVNLDDWRKRVQGEITQWRRDPNYIPVMPLPLGYQSIGGDARALILHQEIRVWSEHICAGMGVPVELVFGGLSWSGTSVSLRMLENQFLGLRKDGVRLVEWIDRKISASLNWRPMRAEFQPFKMADDLQRNQFKLNLVAQRKLSTTTLLEDMEYDHLDEQRQIEGEVKKDLELQRDQQLYMAETQGRASLIQMQYQARAQAQQQEAMAQQGGGTPEQQQQEQAMTGQGVQQAQGQPMPSQDQQQMQAGRQQFDQAVGGPQTAMTQGVNQSAGYAAEHPFATRDLRAIAAQIVSIVPNMAPVERDQYMADLQMRSPDLYFMVQQFLNQPDQGAMQPLPEQRPPRREAGRASI